MLSRYCGPLLICFGLVALVPIAMGEDLYLRLKQAELFSRCGIEVKEVSFGGAVGYSFGDRVTIYAGDTAYPSGYRDRVTIAVYGTVKDAQRAYRERLRLLAIGPPPPPEGDPIGDEMHWGYSTEGPGSPGATITFRRRNILLTLRKRAAPSDVVTLARQIDTLIRDNRQIAPLGTFAETPEILDAGIPTRLSVRPMKRELPYDPASGTGTRDGQPELRNPGGSVHPLAFVTIQPQFRGLGDVSKLRLKLVGDKGYVNLLEDDRSPAGREFSASSPPYFVPDGPDRVRAVPRSEAAAAGIDGRFIMRVAVPSAPKMHKLTLIAATEDNLIVRKEIRVRVVPAD